MQRCALGPGPAADLVRPHDGPAGRQRQHLLRRRPGRPAPPPRIRPCLPWRSRCPGAPVLVCPLTGIQRTAPACRPTQGCLSPGWPALRVCCQSPWRAWAGLLLLACSTCALLPPVRPPCMVDGCRVYNAKHCSAACPIGLRSGEPACARRQLLRVPAEDLAAARPAGAPLPGAVAACRLAWRAEPWWSGWWGGAEDSARVPA
jgi:hypothetical protein